MSTFLLFTPY